MSGEFEEIRGRLEAIAEELADLAIVRLRESIDAGGHDPVRLERSDLNPIEDMALVCRTTSISHQIFPRGQVFRGIDRPRCLEFLQEGFRDDTILRPRIDDEVLVRATDMDLDLVDLPEGDDRHCRGTLWTRDVLRRAGISG